MREKGRKRCVAELESNNEVKTSISSSTLHSVGYYLSVIGRERVAGCCWDLTWKPLQASRRGGPLIYATETIEHSLIVPAY